MARQRKKKSGNGVLYAVLSAVVLLVLGGIGAAAYAVVPGLLEGGEAPPEARPDAPTVDNVQVNGWLGDVFEFGFKGRDGNGLWRNLGFRGDK